MKIKMKPSFINIIRWWAVFLLIGLAAILLFGFTIKTFREIESRSDQMRSAYQEEQRKKIKSEVIRVAKTIEYERDKIFREAETIVKARVFAAHAMAQNIYHQNIESKTKKDIQKIIIDSLRPIRLDQGKGYYFINDLDGISRLFADRPDLEGISLLNRQDSHGKNVLKDMIRIVQSEGEGFYSYRWTKPGRQGNNFEKLAFVKHFKPFDWFIGTGFYIDDLESAMHKTILQYVETNRFGPKEKGYVFVYELLDINGGKNFARIYANPKPNVETGKMISDEYRDAGGKQFRKEFLKGLREKGECFVDYWYTKIDHQDPSPKTSFFKLAADGRFVVAAGLYLDDIEDQILLMQTDMKDKLLKGFFTICSIFIVAILIILLHTGHLNKRLEKDFSQFAQFFKLASDASTPIDRGKVKFSELDQLAVFANDMLSQKTKVEHDLKKARESLSAAQKMARVGHYIFDINTGIWSSSPELDDIFGIDDDFKKDVSGWLQIIHPDFVQVMSDYLKDHVLSRHQKFDKEYKIIHKKTGRVRWVHGLGDLKFDENNTPWEMFGTIQDITERKQTEESMRLTQFIFDKAAIGIFQTASNARILNGNEQAAGSLGYTVEELSGLTIYDINPTLKPGGFDLIWQAFCEKGYNNFETVHQRKDGTTFPVEITADLVEYDGEKFSISFVRDISERGQAEQKRKELEDKLQQTQKMEAIGTLAGGIAHDFNNILSGILGYAQLIQIHSEDPEKTKNDVEQIIKGAKRATDLTRQILTFSRQSEYSKQPYKIYLEIKEALKLLRSSIPSTIEIISRLDSTRMVLADPVRIHQVIMNLCTNAYHAMRKTGGCMTVALTDIRVSKTGLNKDNKIIPGEYIRLEVSDTGCGMDQKTLQRVFEPYFTTKEKGDGTGLGLALVQAIVEEHDGFLEIDSAPGKGTRFYLYFPVVSESVEEDNSKIENDPLPTGNETIMLVDDEEAIRKSCKAFLKKCGYHVRTFSNGINALDAFKMNPDEFDLIITDMTMPGLTGEKFAAGILEIAPDMPVVLCTGFNENISRDQALKQGITEFMQKPVLNQDLAVLVRELLDKANA